MPRNRFGGSNSGDASTDTSNLPPVTNAGSRLSPSTCSIAPLQPTPPTHGRPCPSDMENLRYSPTRPTATLRYWKTAPQRLRETYTRPRSRASVLKVRKMKDAASARQPTNGITPVTATAHALEIGTTSTRCRASPRRIWIPNLRKGGLFLSHRNDARWLRPLQKRNNGNPPNA